MSGPPVVDVGQLLAANPRLIQRMAMLIGSVVMVIFWLPAAAKYYGGGGVMRFQQEDVSVFIDQLQNNDDRMSAAFMVSRLMFPDLAQRAEKSQTGIARTNLSRAEDPVQVDVVAWRRGTIAQFHNTHGSSSSFVTGGQLVFAETTDNLVTRCRTAGAGVVNIGLTLPQNSRYAVLCQSSQGSPCIEYRTSAGAPAPTHARQLLSSSKGEDAARRGASSVEEDREEASLDRLAASSWGGRMLLAAEAAADAGGGAGGAPAPLSGGVGVGGAGGAAQAGGVSGARLGEVPMSREEILKGCFAAQQKLMDAQ